MGIVPPPPPWREDEPPPTEQQWAAYGATLESLMSRTWLGRRHLRRVAASAMRSDEGTGHITGDGQ
jgi:hypothetical protein